MALPTRDEISKFNSLDELKACESFLGKDLEQAKRMFQENPQAYQEDLLWMGSAAFRYYIPAAIAYVESDEAIGDSCFLSSLATTFELRVEWERDEMSFIAHLLALACRYIIDNWERFKVETEFYGDILNRYIALEQLFVLMTGEKPFE